MKHTRLPSSAGDILFLFVLLLGVATGAAMILSAVVHAIAWLLSINPNTVITHGLAAFGGGWIGAGIVALKLEGDTA